MEAFARLAPAAGKPFKFARNFKSIEEVLERYRIAAVEDLSDAVGVPNTMHRQAVVARIVPYVSTCNSIVFDAPVR